MLFWTKTWHKANDITLILSLRCKLLKVQLFGDLALTYLKLSETRAPYFVLGVSQTVGQGALLCSQAYPHGDLSSLPSAQDVVSAAEGYYQEGN